MAALLAGINWTKVAAYVAPLVSYAVAYIMHRAPKPPAAS